MVTAFIPAVYLPLEKEELEDVEVHLKLRAAALKKVETHFKSLGIETLSDYLTLMAAGLPREVGNDTIINMSTVAALTPQWNKNIGLNYTAMMAKGRDIETMPRKTGRAIVIGAGPSVQRRSHLAALAEARSRGVDDLVVVCDRMLISTLRAGVVPDLVCSIDASEKTRAFFMDPIVEESIKKFDVLMAADCDPEVVKWVTKRTDRTYFVVPGLDDALAPNISAIWYQFLQGKFPIVNCAGNVGTVCWAMAGFLGRLTTALIGFNMGYETDQTYYETAYYRALCEQYGADPDGDGTGEAMQQVKSLFRGYENPCVGLDYVAVSDVVFDGYARSFVKFIEINAPDLVVYNCTEGGILCGHALGVEAPFLRCVPFADFLAGREKEAAARVEAMLAERRVPAVEAK